MTTIERISRFYHRWSLDRGCEFSDLLRIYPNYSTFILGANKMGDTDKMKHRYGQYLHPHFLLSVSTNTRRINGRYRDAPPYGYNYKVHLRGLET